MSESPSYWFAAKRYGWGWGLPVCWQGWLVFSGYLALIIGGGLYFKTDRDAAGFLIYAAVLTVIFVAIVAVKGERPLRWRWGK